MAPKQLQLLRELAPNAALSGALADPAFPATPSIIADLQVAARTLGLQLVVVNARTDSDLKRPSQLFPKGTVLVTDSAFFPRRAEQLAALAARHALPAIFQFREFALAGGLMSYGSSQDFLNHQAAIYAARIVKGEKPGDLPVVQTSKPELVINLKTAKARAQRSDRVRRIGVLSDWHESDPESKSCFAALVQRLRELGWTDGWGSRTGRVRENAEPGSNGHQLVEQLQSFLRQLDL